MDITWFGHNCFRLKSRDATVLMDPCAKATGYSLGKQQANIVTISIDRPENSNIEAVTGEPRRLDAPGEYEIGGVLLTGVRTAAGGAKEGERRHNTIFVVEMDDLRICHLGDIAGKPTAAQIEALGEIDVLLVPVGGHDSLTAATAAEIIAELEPRLVAPMRYATDSTSLPLDPLDTFIKQMGATAATPQPKLTVTRASLPATTQVTVLDYRG